MKSVICVFLTLMVLLALFAIPASAEHALPVKEISAHMMTTLRAGGGSSGGGGGSSGGGSSSGSSHHTGRGPRGENSIVGNIFTGVLFVLFFFGAAVVFRLKLSKYARNTKKLMSMLERRDSAWKYKHIQKQVKTTYFVVQKAWTDANLEPAKPYMSETLFESFQTKINWMVFKQEKNVLKNIQLKDAVPVSVYDHPDDTLDHVWFYIKGKMIDYTVNTETNQRINGNPLPTTFEEYWQFTREQDHRWVLNQILQKDEADQIAFTEQC